jgi:hypothetical protein
MPILAGQKVTADQLTHLQPKSYSVTGTGNLVGPVTNADVPGCSITLTTETAGATYKAWIVIDHDKTTANSTVNFGRLNVDGANQAATTASAQDAVTDRTAAGQNYHGVLATAGAHTLKVVASPPTGNQVLGTNTTLVVEITEAV